jgi:hypothetical protein
MTDGGKPHDRLAVAEAAAHRLYFEQHRAIAALPRWRLCSALGPPKIETQLALAHCEIEAGADQDLPAVGIAGPVAPSAGRALDYAELILSCAWTHYNNGDALRASKLARLVAAVDPHFRSVYEQQILAPPSGPAGVLPAPAGEPLPFERQLQLTDDAAARDVIARHGRGVLLFMPWLRREPGRQIESSHCRQLRATLEELGIPVSIIESFQLDNEEHLQLHDRLRGAIAEFRPSVIMCADMMVAGATRYQPLQDGILSVLDEARRKFGCKLVYTYTDTWYDGMAELLEAMAELPDLFHIPAPGVLRRVAPEFAARVFCYTNPLENLRPAGMSAAGQHPRASFVGSIGWANLSRLVWCTEIARAQLPVDMHLTTAGSFRTPEGYAELLAEYAISVNLAARISGDRISTGRTAEVPFYGSLLLEEASEESAYFMRPYEHFVPFASLAELSDRLQLLLRDEPLRRRITMAGTAWTRRHFSALPFWARLFHRLFETDAPPPTKPRQHFSSVTVCFPHSAQSYFELARPLRDLPPPTRAP